MPYSHDLLALSRALTGMDARRPSRVNLDKAVATAYYALFHFLIEQTTTIIFGAGAKQKKVRELAGRAFMHSRMKAFFREVAKPTPSSILQAAWVDHAIPNQKDLQLVARVFSDLQEERHLADYDHAHRFARADAIDACDSVSAAMTAWKRLCRQHSELALYISAALILWPSLSQR